MSQNTEQSFIEYWRQVDLAMQKHFGIDTSDAGIEPKLIAAAQEEGQSSEDFAHWYGSKYDLSHTNTNGMVRSSRQPACAKGLSPRWNVPLHSSCGDH